MANPGVGSKFVSVNLNKSYGQPSHAPHSTSFGSTRPRPGTHGGGGGGMVVLSRPRSSQKAKLSVPPPLNLPSLRKEHERFDLSRSGGGQAGAGTSGSGSRPNSSGMGWTKPGGIALPDKDGAGNGISASETLVTDSVASTIHTCVAGGSKGNDAYMPPSVRTGTMGSPVSSSAQAQILPSNRAAILRGEDFPSLHATLPSASGLTQKQKDGSQQKSKHGVGEESPYKQRDNSHSSLLSHMRLHSKSSRHDFGNGLSEHGENRSFGVAAQSRKQMEYFPGPLPLVHLSTRSDWADDERDTSHGVTDRSRDHGNPKTDAYWDREFDIPRSSVMPHKPAHSVYDRWGHQREDDTFEVSSRDVPKLDSYGNNARIPSTEGQDGNSWRCAQFKKDGFSTPGVANDRNVTFASSYTGNHDLNKENKFISSSLGDSGQNDFGGASRNRETIVGRRDVGFGQGGRQQWNHQIESHGSRGSEKNSRYVSEQYSRYRGDSFQNSSGNKSSFSSGLKGPNINDPILNFNREKRPVSKNDKSFLEDPFSKDFSGAGFDDRDPFSGGLVGVVKRKKDVPKQDDFHDPVRESFEAELERVQKMQEQERQRIVEEQERALELARREEEERMRLAREQEEMQRRLEVEAREAAWRAEQEHLEAMQKAEDQRIAREEEKQRILMEEDRRKQAAKLKLQELEARIAKRQAEKSKGNHGLSHVAEETGISTAAYMGDWEDGERMVERITASASSDSSCLSRSFEVGSRRHFPRDGYSAVPDRGKPNNPWKRDVFENGCNSAFPLQDQDNSHHSPQRDSFLGRRGFPGKDLNGGGGFSSSKNYFRGGVPDFNVDELAQMKGQRSLNLYGDGDHYGRSTDYYPEFHDNYVEKFGDGGWGQGRSHGSSHSPYPERPYQNSFDADGPYSFNRSRYSMRQPRVLPPPVSAMQKIPLRCDKEFSGPATLRDSEMQCNHAARNEPTAQTDYRNGFQEIHEQSELVDARHQESRHGNQNLEKSVTPRCDSQSSLSVSSPPNSPAHLSHDDFDETADSPTLSASVEGKDAPFSGNQSTVLTTEDGKDNSLRASSTISASNDEEWANENNQELQEQEYDEDVDSYQEDDEAHEGGGEIELTQEFKDWHLEETSSPPIVENLVLGFDEGVEVRMPSDECEKSSQKEEDAFVIPLPQISGTPEVRGQILGSADGSAKNHFDKSARVVQQTENHVQDLATNVCHDASHSMVSSDIVDPVNVSSGACLPSQSPAQFSTNLELHSSSGLTGVHAAVSAAPNQAELPVKLQFGLFSGPSLIPSPVSAIQIGSIQMPFNLHPQVGPSLSHIHPQQPPLFQFGQLRYTSPLSQGILPLAPHSVPYVNPSVSPHFTLNKNPGGHPPAKPCQDHSSGLNHLKYDGLSQENVLKEENAMLVSESGGNAALTKQGQSDMFHIIGSSARPGSGHKVEGRGLHDDTVVNSHVSLSNNKGLEGQLLAEAPSFLSMQSERNLIGLKKAQGLTSGGKARKFYNGRNYGSRSSFLASEASRGDSSGYQRRSRRNMPRTEFRVRENVDMRQSSDLVSYSLSRLDEKSNSSGRVPDISARSGSKTGPLLNKLPKVTSESQGSGSGSNSARDIDSGSSAGKGTLKGQHTLHSGKQNIFSDVVEAPLQSGIVRVFEQPGIEVSSDEDDFIEVRSKKQMLHDRREQREKEIKAKSRLPKIPPKARPAAQSTLVSTRLNKISSSLGDEVTNMIHSDVVGNENRSLTSVDVSAGSSTTVVSQPLAPIGTPPLNTDGQTDLRSLTTQSIQSLGGKGLKAGLIFEAKNKVMEDVQTSKGSWGNAQINQQVMSLMQGQLDEAIMNPARYETRAVSIGERSGTVNEPSMSSSSSSILAKDISFSSATQSPINSLLAGEKIQFGAVTSPTILPSSSRAVSPGIGPPRSSHSDIQIPPSFSTAENDCTLLDDSCVHLEDCEVEAEAAASAVAVAAISADEVVGNGLSTSSASVSDGKNFGGEDIDGAKAGVSKDHQLSSQSRAEESLSVALPADLSVETPPLSLWPPLLSPQNSSSQILSHFPGGPPSHFPFYDVNPMLGGPIFAFGPHEESAGTQAQSLKSSTPRLGQLGTWPHHSGVDSFYGPPTGFTGPFISPSGGIPGVQGPPHMVVYNHFAPVGQFGQVGLSFMGTTYIPSGKQPDWKHNPTSAPVGIGEGDVKNMNIVSAQHSPPNIPTPVRHLAPGSPLLPMASPLAMFDVPPFQGSSDMSVRPQWSHVSAPPIHSVPLSLPLQQQCPDVLPSEFSHRPSANQSQTASKFSESQTAAPTNGGRRFPSATDAAVTHLSNELRLVDLSSSSANCGPPVQSVLSKSSRGSMVVDSGKSIAPLNSNGENVCNQTINSAFKTQSSQQRNVSSNQYNHSTPYNYQRGGGITQKNPACEWSPRRMGFQGRNQSVGADKGTKVKQIYVAKQSNSGTSSSA